jgi:hypothetical protein
MPASPDPDRAFCIACGHGNVPEARFCNRCGSPMPIGNAAPGATPAGVQTTGGASERPAALVGPPSPLPPPSSERPSSEPGRRALWLVGFGLLAVLVIYVATTLGRRDGQPASTAGAESPAGPAQVGPAPELDPGAVAELPLPDSLQRDAEAAARLVEGARTANTAAAWDDAGRIYLDLARRSSVDLRPTLAQQAVAAFTRSLEIEDNPDVRTRMVSAYRYDPSATMQPVLELQRVLTSAPNHPEANFQMGELRLQINRLDSAVASFERAAANAPQGSILQRDAEMMAERARQAAAAAPPAPPAGGG